MSRVLDEIRDEMQRAEDRYGPFSSTHEGYGVLAEEVAELFDAIRLNDLGAVRQEAKQVAAVAARIADSLAEESTRDRSVK
jgi:NTP pyrophosphatase (non-canonical NTP hydrolase)